MSAAKTTTNHEVIRRWVEKHGGNPATVKRTRSRGDVGLIRIDFPGFSGEQSLEAIPWSEWFRKFDEQKLAFLYQEGKDTNFNKLVRREPERARTTRGSRRQAGRSGKARSTGARSSKRASSSRANASRQQVSTGGRRAQPSRSRRNGTPARGGVSLRRGGNLRDWTKAELYARARSAGVERRSTMSKDELIRALTRQQG